MIEVIFLDLVFSVFDLVYVIFILGFMGILKGVMIDYCGVVNIILDIN